VAEPTGESEQPPEQSSNPTPEQAAPATPGPRRRRVLIAAAAGLAVVLAAAIAVSVIVVRGNSDQARIQKVVDDFASAVDQGDQARIVSLLCTQEATAVTEDDDYDPANRPGPATGARKAVRTSDIRVTGGTASARVSRSNQPDATLHFRKEAGVWKVCASAGDR
jgi:hypothetical protein